MKKKLKKISNLKKAISIGLVTAMTTTSVSFNENEVIASAIETVKESKEANAFILDKSNLQESNTATAVIKPNDGVSIFCENIMLAGGANIETASGTIKLPLDTLIKSDGSLSIAEGGIIELFNQNTIIPNESDNGETLISLYKDGSILLPSGCKLQLDNGTNINILTKSALNASTGDIEILDEGALIKDSIAFIVSGGATIKQDGTITTTDNTDIIFIKNIVLAQGANLELSEQLEDTILKSSLTLPTGAEISPYNSISLQDDKDIILPSGAVIKLNQDATKDAINLAKDGTISILDEGYIIISKDIVLNIENTDSQLKLHTDGAIELLKDFTAQTTNGNAVIKQGSVINQDGSIKIDSYILSADTSFIINSDGTINALNTKSQSNIYTNTTSNTTIAYQKTIENRNFSISGKAIYRNNKILMPNGGEITLLDGQKITVSNNAIIKQDKNIIIDKNRVILIKNMYNNYQIIEMNLPKIRQKMMKFSDIKKDTWYYGYIREAYNLNLVAGATEKRFRPNSTIKKSDASIMIKQMLGITGKYENNFANVLSNVHYYNNVSLFEKYGILNGYNANFSTEGKMTREEAIVLLADVINLFDINTKKTTQTFDDYEEISDYAKESVNKLKSFNIIEGHNGKINPKQKITRAEFAKIALNVYKVLKDEIVA